MKILCFTENDSNLVITNYIVKEYEFDWKKSGQMSKTVVTNFHRLVEKLFFFLFIEMHKVSLQTVRI